MATEKASQGGTHEQHVRAGQLGGEATAATHGEEFYREIGRRGGKSRQNNGNGPSDIQGEIRRRDEEDAESEGDAESSGSHHTAAGFHASAAYHHHQAADSHARGAHEEGRRHASTAHQHSQNAHAHSTQAQGHSHKPRGGTSEQHAQAGKQSHKNN